MVSAGMPLDSVESAEKWRAAHTKEGLGHKSASASVTNAARAMAAAKKPRGTPAPADDPGGLLARRRDIEQRAYALIDAAVKQAETIQAQLAASTNTDPEALKTALANVDSAFASLPGLIRTYNQAAENAIQSEIRWEKHQRATGSVAPTEHLLNVLHSRLEPLRSQLANFPRTIAAQANPQQPALAERVIADGLAALQRQISSATTTPVEAAPAAS